MNSAGAVPTGCSAIRVAAGYSHLWKCKGFLCLVKGRPCYMDWHIAVWGMHPVYNVNRLFVRHTIAVAHRERSGWNQSHDHAFGLDDFGRQGRFIGILSVLLLPSQ